MSKNINLMNYADNETLLPALQKSFDAYNTYIENASDLNTFEKYIITYYNNHSNKRYFYDKTNKGEYLHEKYKKYKKYYKNHLQVKDRQMKNRALDAEVVDIFCKLVKNAILRLPYTNPLDRLECESGAMMDLLFYWTSFDIHSRTNPFAYFTSVIYMGCAKEFKRLKINQNKLFISFDPQSGDENDGYTLYSI